MVRDEDSSRENDHGQRGRLHTDGEALDDVRRVAGLGRGRDRLDGIPARARVVLGDADEQYRDREADQRRPIEVPERELPRRVERLRDGNEQRRRDDGRHEHGAVERIHDVPAGPHACKLHADDRGDDRHAPDHERVEEEIRPGRRRLAGDSEQHDRNGGDRVRLEQVGGHAGAVADVVTDVVGDDRRVAWVVLRDARLDLPDEVSTDVCGLRVDTAAESREHRDERATEGEPDEVVNRRRRRVVEHADEEPVVAGDAEQAEADDEQAGDGARAEGDVERLRQAGARRFGCPHVRTDGDVHPDEAGGGREHRADQETDRGSPPERVVEAE